MQDFIFSILTQAITFVPLALGISISLNVLRATDMTLDGSFIIGAAIFARLVTMGAPPLLAALAALLAGALSGMLAASIQRSGKVDALLAGVLATFILSSLSLIIMGKPNINLLSETTLVSAAFVKGDLLGWGLVTAYTLTICTIVFVLLKSRFGLFLRAFGDNPLLLKRSGKNTELYRLLGFALTNSLAAFSGMFTSQTIGYADISMGFGMTLTGIGTVIIGGQILKRFYIKKVLRAGSEFISCLIGAVVYFFLLNFLLRIGIDPIYLKMILGLLLILFLATSVERNIRGT